MPGDPDEKITIRHSKLGGQRAVVTRKQLDEVWKDKGWVEASDDPDTIPEPGAEAEAAAAEANPKKGG